MTRGAIYMVFGEPAARDARASIDSLRQFIPDFPIIVVGDTEIEGAEFVKWEGPYPYRPKVCHHFHSGYIKPELYRLSPYDQTMYVDADTLFVGNPEVGFDLLDRWDIAVPTHVTGHDVGTLYQVPLADWAINVKERMGTVEEWNDGDVPFWNTGIVFWNRCEQIERVFAAWTAEWDRWQEWDDQLSLMRAVYKNPCRVCVLPIEWNSPIKEQAKILYHWYGKGTARTDG